MAMMSGEDKRRCCELTEPRQHSREIMLMKKERKKNKRKIERAKNGNTADQDAKRGREK